MENCLQVRRYVYGVWIGSSPKLFYSIDFGMTWTDADPTDTIIGSGTSANVAISSEGRYIYFNINDSSATKLIRGIRTFYPIKRMGIKR